MAEKSLAEKILEIPYWYHAITLPDGTVTPGWSPVCMESYGVPEDLTGKRVLDIGAWDGFWTFEALRRGAKEVIAIDDFSDNLGVAKISRENKWKTFDLCREAFGYTEEKCKRIEMSVYDIEKLGHFDIVFFFGTVYHLKNPYLALEKISAICDGEIYIESAICDDYSPYRGGLNKGYPNNDMVMEFYPGKQCSDNENNWWYPTLQCLGAMVESVGFKNIQAWGLTDTPKDLNECRGFIYGSKTGAGNPNVDKLAHTETVAVKRLSFAAVMSVPRLGFQDNMFCTLEALTPLRMPLIRVQGVFWGQCLERGIQTQIDTGADVIMTVDYDTVFSKQDVISLMNLMEKHPEVDVIVPIHVGRGGMHTLLTMKSKSGQVRELVPRSEFELELSKIATGHFGLTMIRTSALLKMPHPWFWGQPNQDGQWGAGRIDDDIYFWKQAEKFGWNVCSANRVVVGHLELVTIWPDTDFKTIYQIPADYQKTGKPQNAWK